MEHSFQVAHECYEFLSESTEDANKGICLDLEGGTCLMNGWWKLHCNQKQFWFCQGCIIQEVVQHGVKPFKTSVRARSYITNDTAVRRLHSLNMNLACWSGVICDQVMIVILIESNIRKGNW